MFAEPHAPAERSRSKGAGEDDAARKRLGMGLDQILAGSIDADRRSFLAAITWVRVPPIEFARCPEIGDAAHRMAARDRDQIRSR
jgi:hypothetical protein